MAIYIVLFALVLLASFLMKVKVKVVGVSKEAISGIFIYWIFVFILIALIEGLRDISVGIDLRHYIQAFKSSGNITLSWDFWLDFHTFEPGYRLFNYLLFKISGNPRFFIFTTSVIITFLHTFFLYKNSKDFSVSILLFLGFDFFFTSMVSIRQFIAMGIVFWCYPAALNKHYKKYAILALTGFFFHQSSVICALIILIAVLFKRQKGFVKVAFVVAMLLLPVIDSIYTYMSFFFRKYKSYYLLGNFEAKLGKLRIVYIVIEIVLVLLSFFRHKNKCIMGDSVEREERITSLGIFLIVGIYLGIVSSVVAYAFRLGFYFDYFMLLYIPEMLDTNHKYYKLFRIGVILVSIVFYGYYLTVNPGMTIPYSFYKGY